jgi:hypothetical protein
MYSEELFSLRALAMERFCVAVFTGAGWAAWGIVSTFLTTVCEDMERPHPA